MRPKLRVIAGRPLSVEQQGAVLRDAFTLQRSEEAGDDLVDAANQVLRAMGFVFLGLFAVTLLFVAVAVVLSIGGGS